MSLVIKDGEPLDPDHEAPDIQEYWRMKLESRTREFRPKSKLERLLEVELFSLPPGGAYSMDYQEWLRVSGGIKNPYKYMKDRYGSAIVCTRNTQGVVVFQKIEDEDLFHDYKEDLIEDHFHEKYDGAPIEVRIGDYWFEFAEQKIRKWQILSFDKEAMRYNIHNVGYSNAVKRSKIVTQEGYLDYGKNLTSRGPKAYPYHVYFDRLWHAHEYRVSLFYKQMKIYGLFRCFENYTHPDVLNKMNELSGKYIEEMYKIKHAHRAALMAYRNGKKEAKKLMGKDEQKWLE
jgi:hypothetical protein